MSLRALLLTSSSFSCVYDLHVTYDLVSRVTFDIHLPLRNHVTYDLVSHDLHVTFDLYLHLRNRMTFDLVSRYLHLPLWSHVTFEIHLPLLSHVTFLLNCYVSVSFSVRASVCVFSSFCLVATPTHHHENNNYSMVKYLYTLSYHKISCFKLDFFQLFFVFQI